MEKILDQENVSYIDDLDAVRIIYQTLLPGEIRLIDLKEGQELWDAIYLLKVRGAPAIGVFAAFALYCLLKRESEGISGSNDFLALMKEKSDFLSSSRPTAVNLSWALKRMR